MLLLKRLITTGVLFVAFFVAYFLAVALFVGGGLGARAAYAPQVEKASPDYLPPRQAGYEAGREHSTAILLGCAGLAAIGSVALSFSGALPWCRREDERKPATRA